MQLGIDVERMFGYLAVIIRLAIAEAPVLVAKQAPCLVGGGGMRNRYAEEEDGNCKTTRRGVCMTAEGAWAHDSSVLRL